MPTLFVFRFTIEFGFTELLFILFFIHILKSPLWYILSWSFRLWAEFSHWKNGKIPKGILIMTTFKINRFTTDISLAVSPEYSFPIWNSHYKNEYIENKTCHSLPTLQCNPQSSLPPNLYFFTWVWVPHPNYDNVINGNSHCRANLLFRLDQTTE